MSQLYRVLHTEPRSTDGERTTSKGSRAVKHCHSTVPSTTSTNSSRWARSLRGPATRRTWNSPPAWGHTSAKTATETPASCPYSGLHWTSAGWLCSYHAPPHGPGKTDAPYVPCPGGSLEGAPWDATFHHLKTLAHTVNIMEVVHWLEESLIYSWGIHKNTGCVFFWFVPFSWYVAPLQIRKGKNKPTSFVLLQHCIVCKKEGT